MPSLCGRVCAWGEVVTRATVGQWEVFDPVRSGATALSARFSPGSPVTVIWKRCWLSLPLFRSRPVS